jgi:hypothetical protein
LKTLILDVETENTGHDIMADNKRIISVQIGNSTNQELWYADAPSHDRSLARAKERINGLIEGGTVFSGYNITGFDIPILEKFLDVKIPAKNLIELSKTDLVTNICRQRNRNTLRLEDICAHLGINSHHKDEMNQRAETYKTRPEIVLQAREAARDLASRRGWDLDFSLGYAVDKIAGGHAIFDSYKDFITSNGSEDTLFYRYAVGDVISEYKLLIHTGNN